MKTQRETDLEAARKLLGWFAKDRLLLSDTADAFEKVRKEGVAIGLRQAAELAREESKGWTEMNEWSWQTVTAHFEQLGEELDALAGD